MDDITGMREVSARPKPRASLAWQLLVRLLTRVAEQRRLMPPVSGA